MSEQCNDCHLLQARIKTLEAENKQLRKYLTQAVKVIKAQKQQLDQVRLIVFEWIRQGQEAMQAHLPRGTWALWRGRYEVAGQVYNEVYLDFARSFLARLGVN